jgi:hypothetical protein
LSVLTRPISIAIGHALGRWLHSFHSWSSKPAQAELRRVMADNKPMRQIRYSISYGAFVDVVRKFPEVWGPNQKVLGEVRDMAIAEYANTSKGKVGEDWGIIHGDFWSGK